MFYKKLKQMDLKEFFEEKLGLNIDYIYYNNEEGKLRFTYLRKNPMPHYEEQIVAVCDQKLTLIPSYDVIDTTFQKFMEEKFGDEYRKHINDLQK